MLLCVQLAAVHAAVSHAQGVAVYAVQAHSSTAGETLPVASQA